MKFFTEVGLAWQYKVQRFSSSKGKLKKLANIFTLEKKNSSFPFQFFVMLDDDVIFPSVFFSVMNNILNSLASDSGRTHSAAIGFWCVS